MATFDDTLIFVLNSKDALKQNGTMNSNVVFNFPASLKENPKIIKSHIQLISCQIPVSFYIINQYNNVLKYTIASIIYTVSIPFGNYNAFNLITAITTAFSINGHSITTTFNRIDGKMTFTGTTAFTFNTLNSTILKVLGFLPTINTTSVANVIIAPFPLNLIGIKRLTLSSNSLSTVALNSNNYQTQSILGTVFVSEPAWGLIKHKTETNVNHILRTKLISAFEIRITDEDSNLIDFNNQEWLMKLKMSSTYEIVLDSETTFNGITGQQILKQEPPTGLVSQQKKPAEPQPSGEPEPEPEPQIFTMDNDLATLLYNSKAPRK